MADDSYKTIKQIAEGYYTEKRSRFISYAIPVRTVEEVKEQLDKYRKQYYDARPVSYTHLNASVWRPRSVASWSMYFISWMNRV